MIAPNHPIGAERDGSRTDMRDVQSATAYPTGEAGAPNLSTYLERAQ